MKSTTGEALFNTVSSRMRDLQLDMQDLVGASSDGASNMSGEHNGVGRLPEAQLFVCPLL